MATLWWLASYYRMLEEQYLEEQREKFEKEKLQKPIFPTANQEAEIPISKPKENKSRRETIMCSYAQLEKIVEYMEKNGDLSRLTYKGGSHGERLIADAGWKELATDINGTFGVEKNTLQLRRNWSEFKSKIQKKVIKLQQYKDYPVGRPPFPLTDLELRVLSLKESDEDQAPASSGGPESESSERPPVLRTPENVVKAKHNLELPLPPRPMYVKKEEKLMTLTNSPNGNNNAASTKIAYIKISPKSPKEPVTPTVQNNFPIHTSKAEDNTPDAAILNAVKLVKAKTVTNGNPDLEHIAMEQEFLHLTHIYDQTQAKMTNDKKINKPVEKPVMQSNGIRNTEPKTDKVINHAKRNFAANLNLIEKENQNSETTQNHKKSKVSPTEDVISLFLDHLKEQRQMEMKREEKRMVLEDKRLDNEREALRQRDVQLAQNAQILNVVVQLAELTERVLNKKNQQDL